MTPRRRKTAPNNDLVEPKYIPWRSRKRPRDTLRISMKRSDITHNNYSTLSWSGTPLFTKGLAQWQVKIKFRKSEQLMSRALLLLLLFNVLVSN